MVAASDPARLGSIGRGLVDSEWETGPCTPKPIPVAQDEGHAVAGLDVAEEVGGRGGRVPAVAGDVDAVHEAPGVTGVRA